MARIRVGLCSWTDPQLIKAKTFYPPEAHDAESRLRFYSQNFSVVEVDSSYHAMPSPMNSRLWVERTPQDFVFHVKAFSLFTNHPTKPEAVPRDILEELGPLPEGKANLYYRDIPEEPRNELWRRFVGALSPLEESGKLGRILLQFPTWFHPSRNNREHILECVEELAPYRCSVEFRAASWLNDINKESTLSFLREHDLAFVCVDEPQGFKSSLPSSLAAVTSDLALVRFHGRNAATWEKKGISAAERYNWYYSEVEMEEWVPKLAGMTSEVKEVHALFNTNYSDQSVVNARLLQGMLNLT